MAERNSAETLLNIREIVHGGSQQREQAKVDEAGVDSPVLIKGSSAGIGCSIHRVPLRLLRDNQAAYVPLTISIGPLHYHKRNSYEYADMYFQEMEKHKLRYLKEILSREGKHCKDLFSVVVKEQKERARGCYSQDIKLNDDQFVEMMVLDGCFIIELFRRTSIIEEKAKENGKEEFPFAEEDGEEDPLIKWEWLRQQLAMDLVKLENQLPFFILERLSHLMNISPHSLMEMALTFFQSAQVLPISTDLKMKIPHQEVHHILHLVHSSLLASNSERKENSKAYAIKLIPSATELLEVGIKFEKAQQKANRGFLDVEFQSRLWWLSGGVIKIPQMTLSVYTGTLFLNLAAFEQCYRHSGTAFSAYIVFMDCLVDTEADVRVLCNHGIDNCAGSDKDLVDLVNKIGRKLIIDDERFHKIFEEIDDYYECITNHHFIASIVRNYTRNPTQFLSILLAVLSLVFTVVFQILNYAK